MAQSQPVTEGAYTYLSPSQEKRARCKAKTIWTPDSPLPICAPGSNGRSKPARAGESCGSSCMKLFCSCSISSRDTSSSPRTCSFPWTHVASSTSPPESACSSPKLSCAGWRASAWHSLKAEAESKAARPFAVGTGGVFLQRVLTMHHLFGWSRCLPATLALGTYSSYST